jgi:sugar/nucleoside kinase (ribokinase family)
LKKNEPIEQVDCLGMGIMPLDFLYTIPAMPPSGGKVDATGRCIQGGGPIPNALVGLSRLGLRTALIAVVGDDFLGRLSREELRQDGVDQQLVIDRKNGSATAVGFIEEGSGQRTIAMHRQVGLRPGDFRLADLPRPRFIHVDGRDLEANLKLARWGRRIGATVSIDVGSMRNDVTPLLPLIDHLVVADAFALPYTGTRTARAAVRKLGTVCSGTIVVTEGIKGSVGREDDDIIHQAAFRVPSVDTTGAGDSFHAGYLFGLSRGWSLAQRLEFGAATAALKCTKPGARAGAPTLRQVQRFMKSKPEMYA